MVKGLYEEQAAMLCCAVRAWSESLVLTRTLLLRCAFVFALA